MRSNIGCDYKIRQNDCSELLFGENLSEFEGVKTFLGYADHH